MQFVRSAVLKSKDGVYASEQRAAPQRSAAASGAAGGQLDYFSNKDGFVSEETIRLKSLHRAGIEERRETTHQREQRALAAQREELITDDHDGPKEHGPAAMTEKEFDFLQAQDLLRRRREVASERDVAAFLREKRRVGEECDAGPGSLEATLAHAGHAPRRRPCGAAEPTAVKAKIKVRKRPRREEVDDTPDAATAPPAPATDGRLSAELLRRRDAAASGPGTSWAARLPPWDWLGADDGDDDEPPPPPAAAPRAAVAGATEAAAATPPRTGAALLAAYDEDDDEG